MIDEKYTKYAEGVVNGTIIAGELIRLACQRYLFFVQGGDPDIEFRPSEADRVVNFCKKLKHYEGEYVGKNFIPCEWQCWMLYNMFGLYRKSTGLRLIRSAYIQIARKCGKSFLASAIGAYMLCADGEAGSQVDIVSPSRKQSAICFESCSKFIQGINKNKLFKILRNEVKFDARSSKLRVMSSDAKFGDGFNTHCGILDEFHAFESNAIPDLLTSSMGMRRQPMMIYITTAGKNYYCPCKDYRDMCENILRGLAHDDSIFSAIYEMDEGDDWLNESNWHKCVPSLREGVAKIDYIRGELTKAKNNPSLLVGVKVKNLNMWCQSADIWIPDKYLDMSMHKVDLNRFPDGELCYMGVDLAKVDDFTAYALLFPPNPEREYFPEKYVFKIRTYCPREFRRTKAQLYNFDKWISEKQLTITPGNTTDYDYILRDMVHDSKRFYMYKAAYDPWNSSQWAINATNIGMCIAPYSQTLASFNRPTKELTRLILQGHVVIDSSALTKWSFKNVELKFDWNENCKPIKAGDDVKNKIDPVIAMIEALGIAMEFGGWSTPDWDAQANAIGEEYEQVVQGLDGA